MPALKRTFTWWQQHLEGIERTSDGFKARCPSHDDVGPSLHVTRKGADNRPPVIHCFAGCKYPDIEMAAREGGRVVSGAPRVKKTRSVSQRPSVRVSDDAAWEWLASYTGTPVSFLKSQDLDVRDGRIAFTFPHNGVAKLRTVGTKDFSWNKDGARPPIWPEVPAELPDTIYLTEGETDCLILRFLEYEAYAITKGGNSTLSPVILAALRARGCEKVVLAFDQDETGYEATDAYTDAVVRAGMAVATMRPPVNPLIGEKDLRDWWHRTSGTETLEEEQQRNFRTFAALQASLPPRPPWVWEGFVAERAITLVAGPPKVGKSSLTFNFMRHVEEALEFLGRPVHQGKVMLLSEEDGWTLLEKQARYNVKDALVLTSTDVAWRGWTFQEALQAATAEAKQEGANTLLIDTLGAWAGFEDENDAAEITKAMLLIRNICCKAGLAVVVVHHTKKGGGEHGEAVRGSSALFAMVDILIEYKHHGKNRSVDVRSRFLNTPAPMIVAQDPDTGALDVISRDEELAIDGTPVLEALAGGDLDRKALMEATGLGDTRVRDLVAALVRLGKVEEVTGERGKKTYRLVADAQDGGPSMRVKMVKHKQDVPSRRVFEDRIE